MNVLIIEDEAPAFRRFEKLLLEVDPNIVIIDVIDSVTVAIEWINSNPKPDLIFMDIQLSDGISFDIFEKVNLTTPVIFTTAFDEYILKAFKVNSIDYLLKPIKKEDLETSLNKFHSLKNEFNRDPSQINIQSIVQEIRRDDKRYKSRILVKLGEKLIAVETINISHFYTHHGNVYLITFQGKKYLIDFNLDELMQQLDPNCYYRANRQYIIHIHAVAIVHKYHNGKLLLELSSKTEGNVLISAEKATDFKNWYGS